MYERLLTHFEDLKVQYPVTNSEPSQDDDYLTTEHHFAININLAWLKLNDYYVKTDATPLYVTAVVLHPRYKKRWFNKKWKERTDWLEMVDDKVNKMWLQYKGLPLDELKFDVPADVAKKQEKDYNDWSSDDDDNSAVNKEADELAQYLAEPLLPTPISNPLKWWTEQLSKWPRLTAMALDVLTIPPISDEPERKFSEAGDVVQPRRRRIKDTTLQTTLCLRSWQRQGLITIDRTLWRKCMASREPFAAPIHLHDGDDEVHSPTTTPSVTSRATTPPPTHPTSDVEPISIDD